MPERKLCISKLLLPLLLISTLSFAQEKITVTVLGTITDAETNLPIPYVNVFFNNTTLGAATDSKGEYQIKRVPVEFNDLIISAIGYATLKTTIHLNSNVNQVANFKLVPDRKLLSTVVIRAKREEDQDWNKNFKLFKEIFLGTTTNSQQTQILNPEVLSFEKVEQGVVYKAYQRVDQEGAEFSFKASAQEPLKIENHALGYRLFVSLEHFTSSRAFYIMQMSIRFDTLTPKDSRERERWHLNRIKTYKGSQRHFFKAITEGRFEEEGYNIYTKQIGFEAPSQTFTSDKRITQANIKDIIVDTTGARSKILKKGVYQIEYLNKIAQKSQRTSDSPFPVSWIEVRDSFLIVTNQGEPLKTSSFWRKGYFDVHRVADMLPQDFNPVKEEERLLLSTINELATIRGRVVDDYNKPLSEVDVFFNNGLTHTTTNMWGQFELPNLDRGKYWLGFADAEKKSELRLIDVSAEDALDVRVKLVTNTFDTTLFNNSFYKTYFTLYNKSFNQERTNIPNFAQFERKLLQASPMVGQFFISNPEVLSVKTIKKGFVIRANSPLKIINTQLGYSWTYFLDSANLIRKRGIYSLQIKGLVKMDFLPASNTKQNQKWQEKRFDEYQGTWNHFAKAFSEGRITDEGFKFYQFNRLENKSRGILWRIFLRRAKPNYEEIIDRELVMIPPDSLLAIKNEKMYLRVPKGLEVHYPNKKGSYKFYRKFSKQIMRLKSDSSQVPIPNNEDIFPNGLQITGTKQKLLKRVPADYKVPYDKVTNHDVLLFIKNTNLKAIKTLLEKVYVQTDKPYYHTGDTIWLKAYLRYATLNYRDTLSKVLYVELINSENNVLVDRILKIKDGQAWGDIAIPINLPAGDYYLRAYTNWMRNFDEFFIRPLPILIPNEFIVSQHVDDFSFAQGDVKLTLQANKKLYKSNEHVQLKIGLLDGLNPISAAFSISVTDQIMVGELDGIPTIQSLEEPFKADGSKFLRIKHSIEKGVTIHGKIKEAAQEEVYTISSLLTPNRGTSQIKVKGSDFRLTYDITDTVTAIIKCSTQSGYFKKTEILARDSINNFLLSPPLTYKIFEKSDTNYVNFSSTNVRVLKEILIRSQKINSENYQTKTLTQTRFGKADRIIEGEEILQVRQTGNLKSFLRATLPNYVAYPFRSYTYFLNGTRVSEEEEDFLSRPYFNISKIEIFSNGGSALSAFDSKNIISIYTEPFVSHYLPTYDKYLLRGYDTPLTFKTPDITSTVDDYRPTMYWNPYIKTDENGNATISFRTSDVEGSYKITIEGVTTEGEIFRVVKLLTIVK